MHVLLLVCSRQRRGNPLQGVDRRNYDQLEVNIELNNPDEVQPLVNGPAEGGSNQQKGEATGRRGQQPAERGRNRQKRAATGRRGPQPAEEGSNRQKGGSNQQKRSSNQQKRRSNQQKGGRTILSNNVKYYKDSNMHLNN